MKRFHVHLGVPDLDASIRFYAGLFGFAPTVRKDDYAKWMLEDPRVNFAISQRANGRKGLNHLGLQAESADELSEIERRFLQADASSTVAETDVACCYARSNKHWVKDPQGIAWEAFHTLDTVPWYDGTAASGETSVGACCAPAGEAQREGASGCCVVPTSQAADDRRVAAKACC